MELSLNRSTKQDLGWKDVAGPTGPPKPPKPPKPPLPLTHDPRLLTGPLESRPPTLLRPRCHCLHFRQSIIAENVTASMFARLSSNLDSRNHGWPIYRRLCLRLRLRLRLRAASSVSKIRPAPPRCVNSPSFLPSFLPSDQGLCDFSASSTTFIRSFLPFFLWSFAPIRIWHSVLQFLNLILSTCVSLFILYWRWRQSFPHKPLPMAL
jgi:hypothetical protein